MSVSARKRKESRLEVICFSLQIHKMLVDLMQKSFGVKDVDQYVRVQYAHSDIYKLLSKQQRRAMLKFYEDLFDRKISIDHGKIIMKES